MSSKTVILSPLRNLSVASEGKAYGIFPEYNIPPGYLKIADSTICYYESAKNLLKNVFIYYHRLDQVYACFRIKPFYLTWFINDRLCKSLPICGA
jgi:hypothetical protein